MCQDIPEEGRGMVASPTKIPKPTISSYTEVPVTQPNQCSYKRNPSAYRFINATQSCHPICTVDNIFNKK